MFLNPPTSSDNIGVSHFSFSKCQVLFWPPDTNPNPPLQPVPSPHPRLERGHRSQGQGTWRACSKSHEHQYQSHETSCALADALSWPWNEAGKNPSIPAYPPQMCKMKAIQGCRERERERLISRFIDENKLRWLEKAVAYICLQKV